MHMIYFTLCTCRLKRALPRGFLTKCQLPWPVSSSSSKVYHIPEEYQAMVLPSSKPSPFKKVCATRFSLLDIMTVLSNRKLPKNNNVNSYVSVIL